MKTFVGIAVVAFVAGPGCAIALADGGQVRASQRFDEYQVTVFTSPSPLRAGPIDVSALIQRIDTGEAIVDADVVVDLVPVDRELPPIRAVATSAAVTNKLLIAANFDLPAAGKWNVCVTITPPGKPARVMKFTMVAAPPLPAWLTVWPWFTWPFAAVLVFAVHRALVDRGKTRSVSQHLGAWGIAG